MSELADRLLDAIREGTSIDIESVPHPGMSEAYEIQAEILRRLEIEPEGRKLALRPDGLLSAPLLSALRDDRFPFEPGLRMEVELAFVLGSDLPARPKPYAREDILQAIRAVHIGVEFIRSRYDGGAQGRTPLLIADLMSNVGYRLGPELDIAVVGDGYRPEHLTVVMNETVVFDAAAIHPDGDPLAGLLAYSNSPDRLPRSLKESFVVTTGSLCGALSLAAPSTISVSMRHEIYSFELTIQGLSLS